MGYTTVRRDLYDSKADSAITSETYYVGDADSVSLFLRGSPSTTTVQGSNGDGRTVDLTNTTDDWSTITTVLPGNVTAPALVDITEGFAYLRLQRSETTEAVLHLQNVT